MTETLGPLTGHEGLRIRAHHPVPAAGHQQGARAHGPGCAVIEQQTRRRTHGHHRPHPIIGQASTIGGTQETALQHPTEVAVRIVEIAATLLQQVRTGLNTGHLQGRGGPPGVADHHHLRHAKGVDRGGHVKGAIAQLVGTGRRHLAGEHGFLLAAVTTRMARQHHLVAVAGQMARPAFKTLGAVPEPMGDQHHPPPAVALGLDHHHLKGGATMGGRHLNLTASHRQATWTQCRGSHGGGRGAGQQGFGLPALGHHPLQGTHGMGQIHGDGLPGQGSQEGEQGEISGGTGSLQGQSEITAAEILGHPIHPAQGGGGQEGLLQQWRAHHLAHHVPRLHRQRRVEHALQLPAKGTTTGTVEFGQITVTLPKGLWILQLAQAHRETHLQQRELKFNPVDRPGRSGPHQHQGESKKTGTQAAQHRKSWGRIGSE